MKILSFKAVQLEELNSIPWTAIAAGVGAASGVTAVIIITDLLQITYLYENKVVKSMKTLTFKEVQLEELNSVPWNVKIAVAGGVGAASGVAAVIIIT